MTGTLKEKILTKLEKSEKNYVSGGQLAESLGVSRTAVWKAICSLREEGYVIEATTNRGYRLEEGSDILSAAGIAGYMRNGDISGIHVFREVDSTNNEAKKLALAGAPHGTVVAAEKQTAGRGRLGRSFESPAGTGIYFTVIMRPKADLRKALLITTAAAVAVCRSIRELTGKQALIKWVNDIYLEEKKLCGILTESTTDFETGELESVVTGIGINFRTPGSAFSEEARARGICSLYGPDSDTGGTEKPPVTRNELIARIIDELTDICDDLDNRSFLTDYRRWSMVIGREILCIRGKERRKVRALDIDEWGGLVVMTEDGNRETLSSGEISVRW